MIELNNIEHIYIFPGLTDMRLGIFGLRKLIIDLKFFIKFISKMIKILNY